MGTSGYQYDHWKDVFYPANLPKKSWFDHYTKFFNTVEINNTFYNLPAAETFDKWRERTPQGFCYTLKFSRYGTHIKRLKEPDNSIGNFVERAERLGEVLGPILVQLPPKWKPVPDRLDAFLEQTPDKYRWCVEVRDPRWLCEEIYDVLRRHNAALCIHDMIENHPRILTADWTYLRYHGINYGGDYSDEVLQREAEDIRNRLAQGIDTYAFFNNDAEGCAVKDAQDLHRFVQEG